MTDKQVQAITNMTNYIDKGNREISMNPVSFDMPSVARCDYKHIKDLLKTGQLKNLGAKSFETQRIFAFLFDYVSKVEDSYTADGFDMMP